MNRDWMDQAACRGEPLHLFFGTGQRGGPGTAGRNAHAKAICARCPVRVECGEYADARPEQYGLWGGLTEDERAAERRKRRGQVNKRNAAARRRAA